MKFWSLLVACLFPALGFAATPTSSVDIGAVGAAGSTSLSNGVYTVNASGADIWGAQDEFRFVYAALSGDGEITARVDSLAAVDQWSKAGVMIRETLNANSRYAYALISSSNGADFQYRQTSGSYAGPGGSSDRVTRAPSWVRVRRAGNVFTAYISPNGTTWTQRGSSVTIQMGASTFIGLAVTSHRDGALAAAAFSNVNIGATQPPPTGNSPPTITGSPATSVTQGQAYSFTPSANDSNGDALTFSIANRPSWATFTPGTGRLNGTPTAANVGTFSNIVISVSDGRASASLAAFAITVQAVNTAPTITGTPLTSVMQGQAYSFTPSANDADGNTLTFSITNRPGWASFDSSTGRLSGTPAASNVGTYSGIVISVSDGQISRSLAAFSINVVATAMGSATLTWTPPTRNTDGSTLTNLAGYKVYWGRTQGSYTNSVTVNNPGLATYVIDQLTSGRWYFAVSAMAVGGAESAKSNEANKLIP